MDWGSSGRHVVTVTGRFVTDEDGDDIYREILHLWDVSTGRCLATYDDETVESFSWSPTGRYFFIIDDSRNLTVHDATDGKVILRPTQMVPGKWSHAWRPNGSAISVWQLDEDHDVFVQVFDLATGQVIDEWRYIHSLGWSPDGSRLVVVDDRAELLVYDAESLDLRMSVNGVSDHRWSPDGSQVVTQGGPVQLWDVETGSLIWEAPVDFFVAQALWSQDRSRVVINGSEFDGRDSGRHFYYVVDTRHEEILFSRVYEPPASRQVFDSTYMRPDGRQFAHFVCRCSFADDVTDDFIFVYDVDTGRLSPTSGPGLAQIWSADSALVSRCVSLDSPPRNAVMVSDSTSGEMLFTLECWGYEERSADSSKIMVCRLDGSGIEIRDAWTGTCEQVVETPDSIEGEDSPRVDFEWSPIGLRAAIVQGDGIVEIWEPTV